MTPPSNLTDRELLILQGERLEANLRTTESVTHEMRRLSDNVQQALTRADQLGSNFDGLRRLVESIQKDALAAADSARQAYLLAETALRVANKVDVAIFSEGGIKDDLGDVKRTLQSWTLYLKIAGAALGALNLFVIPIAIEALKKLIWGP